MESPQRPTVGDGAFNTHSLKSVVTTMTESNGAKSVPAAKSASISLKTPKGTKDWSGEEMIIREKLFSSITSVFKRHGGIPFDTPVFELKEILSEKYGEDSKLIYDLKDQGGEICSLRYDLTVPLARWLAMNTSVQSIKRYQIAKVYRRDQPAMTKGRMREFYQCDFDIVGKYDLMIPDAECIMIAAEVMKELSIPCVIKVNHRGLLDGIFQVCGVPESKIRSVSSAIDKLDKISWDEVKKELIDEKEIDVNVADHVGQYVRISGDFSILNRLKNDSLLRESESAIHAIEQLEILEGYIKSFGIKESIQLDMSLARGLDYYTGIIYELVLEKEIEDGPVTPQVGSIGGGGRYDNLVGTFLKSKKGPKIVPCVGISFGVERLYAILRSRYNEREVRSSETQVLVMAFGSGKEWDGMIQERMKIVKSLWEAGISAEYVYKKKPKLSQQFDFADKYGIPYAIILGQDEWEKKLLRIKRLGMHEASDYGDLVSRDDMIPKLKSLMDCNSFV